MNCLDQKKCYIKKGPNYFNAKHLKVFFITKHYISFCLHGKMIILSFLHLVYDEDNNVSHIRLFQTRVKKKKRSYSYIFSGRGRKLNKSKMSLYFFKSQTHFYVWNQNLFIFCELTNQYVHFVHLHIVNHWY